MVNSFPDLRSGTSHEEAVAGLRMNRAATGLNGILRGVHLETEMTAVLIGISAVFFFGGVRLQK